MILYSDEWGVLGSNTIELRDPRILALAAAQQHFLESEYNEYSTIHSSSVTTSFRLLALIVSFLLLDFSKGQELAWPRFFSFSEKITFTTT
jgi:hypothetical protein